MTTLEPRSSSARDVAIVGMACVFPGAADLKAFWENIIAKVDAITDVPPDRWEAVFYDPEAASNDRLYCQKGGFLGDLARFNPLDFGIMPVAVDGGDPGQFLALGLAQKALADAGYLEKPFNRERTEIILGRGNYLDRGSCNIAQHSRMVEQTIQVLKDLHPGYTVEELQAIKKELKASLPYFGPENAASAISNITTGRIANRMDFMGANFTVDAACASSLIATEMGMRDLQAGKCDMALAGGIFIITDVGCPLVFSQLKALSRNSQIRPLDRNADGTLMGEGAGILVLKRRDDAERDGDRIYALVKGVGISSDGRQLSVTAPRVEGAELALRRAYEIAGIAPQSIGLIEAHGTATPAGDAMEIEALTRVFGEAGKDSSRCALGAVKSMIGHAMPASGAAGLIKATLALYHKVLPPTLHCEDPHPKLKETMFYINNEARPWVHGDRETPRRAGVNAFGFGGINAHVILEEYTGGNENGADTCLTSRETEVFVLEGDSREGMVERAHHLEQFVGKTGPVCMKDLAYSVNEGASRGQSRLAVVASSPQDLQEKLQYALKRLADPACDQIKDVRGVYFFAHPFEGSRRLAFLFPGEGAQYVNMLSDLAIHFPDVRACFDEADATAISHRRGYIPSRSIFAIPASQSGYPGDDLIWRMEGAIEAVHTANMAMSILLKNLGIKPDAVAGHSTGEWFAMLASGVIGAKSVMNSDSYDIHPLFKLYDAMVADTVIPDASMVAVGTDIGTVSGAVEKAGGKVYVAMDNCPHQVVVVGEPEAMEIVNRELKEKGVYTEKLPFGRAYHTPLFKAVCDTFRPFFNEQPISLPGVEVWSCGTAQPYPRTEAEIRELAVDQWMMPVLFRETIEAMYDSGLRIFVEVGPRSNLTGFADDILRKRPHLAVASNIPRRSGITQLNHLVGVLAAQGVPVNLEYLYARRSPRKISLDGAEKPDSPAATMKLVLGVPVMHVAPRPAPAARPGPAMSLEGETDREKKEEIKPEVVPQTVQVKSATQEVMLPEAIQEVPGPAHPAAGNGAGPAGEAMSDYFRTMEHFLEVQEDVMRAYLVRQSPATQETVTGEQGIAVTYDTDGHVETLPAQLAEHAQEEVMPPGPPALPEKVGEKNQESVASIFLNLVSDRTGYPLEMLNQDLDMEADLGIDSIKRIEILGAFQEKYASLVKELNTEQVARLKTLRQVTDFLEAQAGAGTPAVTPPARLSAAAEGRRDANTEGIEGVSSPRMATATSGEGLPFVGEVVSYKDGQEITVVRRFDLKEDLYLYDHMLGGKVSAADPTLNPPCVVPATVSMEVMAEVASCLMPGKLLTGMKDVRVFRWIQVNDRPAVEHITARKLKSEGTEVKVEIRVGVGDAAPQKTPSAQGTMVFGDSYSVPTCAGEPPLQHERPPAVSASEMYRRKMLFHGPSFQGIISLDAVGDNGAAGTLETLPSAKLLASNPEPSMLTDPCLLDAAGQLVGCWALEYLGGSTVIFPIQIGELQIYGPRPLYPGRFNGRAIIRSVAPNQLRSDIMVAGADGRLQVSITGWENYRYSSSEKLARCWREPEKTQVSEPWYAPLAGSPASLPLVCNRLRVIGADQIISWELFIHLILSRREIEHWRNSGMTEERRIKWAFGQLVAKDAVRAFLKERHDLELFPADVDIITDEHGRPVPKGEWVQKAGYTPSLSISHTDGLAVALVSRDNQQVGIDIEHIKNYPRSADKLVFLPEEQVFLSVMDEAAHREWALRFWCAKEAVGKALGRGMVDGPQGLAIEMFDKSTGAVHLSLRGELARAFPEFAGARIVARTCREGDYICASSLCERSEP